MGLSAEPMRLTGNLGPGGEAMAGEAGGRPPRCWYLAENEESVSHQPHRARGGGERTQLQPGAANQEFSAGGAVVATLQRDPLSRQGQESLFLRHYQNKERRDGPPRCPERLKGRFRFPCFSSFQQLSESKDPPFRFPELSLVLQLARGR